LTIVLETLDAMNLENMLFSVAGGDSILNQDSRTEASV
jgi:hypothetical protein